MKTFIFDLDDTLINTKIYAEIYPEILNLIKDKGLDVDEEAKKHNISEESHGRYDSGDLCRELSLVDEYYKILEKQIAVVDVLHNEVKDVFEKLKGNKIGIASNSMRITIELYLNKYELNVDFVFSQDEAGCKKNQQEFWEELIKSHNLNPEECLVIGDNPIDDYEVPKKLGFKTLLMKNFSEVKTYINKNNIQL